LSKQRKAVSPLRRLGGTPVNRVAARVAFGPKSRSSSKHKKAIQRLRTTARKETDPEYRAQLLNQVRTMEAKRDERDRQRLIGAGAVKRAKAALARAKWQREQ
jgi:hypothetical protein